MLKKSKLTLFAAAVLTGLALAKPAAATSITIVNPSFETDKVNDGSFTVGSPSGWTGGQVLNPSTSQMSGGLAADGSNVVSLAPEQVATSSISQTLTATLADSTTYTLTLAVGQRSTLAFDGYSISLIAGTTTLKTITSADAGAAVPAAGLYTNVSLVYQSSANETTAGQALKITISELLGNTGTTPRTLIDNVALDASPVPEPASVCGLALIGGTVLRRKRLSHSTHC